MASSDFLFRLIKSLSKGDRRNLRLFGGLQEGEKKYFLLFDAIDAQREYDEEAIVQQFEGERFLNQLSVAKNYLYNYILKTLHVFHRDQHSELNMLIHQIEILIGKNLHDQAYKQIRKSKQLAKRQERFNELLTLLELQRKVVRATEALSDLPSIFKGISTEEAEAVACLNEIRAYLQLLDEAEVLCHPRSQGEHSKGQIQALVNHALLVANAEASTVKGQIVKDAVLTTLFVALNDLAAAKGLLDRIIDRFESYEEIRFEWNGRFLWALAENASTLAKLGKYQEAHAVLKRLKQAEVVSHEELLTRFYRQSSIGISLCLASGDKKGGLETVAQVEAEIKELKGELDKSVELHLMFLSAYFLLACGDHAKALKLVKKIQNEPRAEEALEVQCMARLLSILIHFELGHFEMIEYLVKSANRFMQNRREMLFMEKVALKHLRILADKAGQADEDILWAAFEKELGSVSGNSIQEKFALDLLDLRIWNAARRKKVLLIDEYRSRVGN